MEQTMNSPTEQREWETFIRQPEDLAEGAEIPLIIRDLAPGRTKYRLRHVVALVSRHPGTLSNNETLWVRTTVGVRLEQPWRIKILRELPLELPGEPYRDVYEALRKAANAARKG